MKAIECAKSGSPANLQLKDVEKPAPKDRQVLVKIHAAAANPADVHRIRGGPFVLRPVMALTPLSLGLRRPKNPRLGTDFAGLVEAVGASVTQFHLGDDVFGGCVGVLRSMRVLEKTESRIETCQYLV